MSAIFKRFEVTSYASGVMILHLERRECQSIDVEGIMVLDGNNHNKREVVNAQIPFF